MYTEFVVNYWIVGEKYFSVQVPLKCYIIECMVGTVLLEIYYLLLKVAFLNCSNAVSFLSSCLNEKGLSSCLNEESLMTVKMLPEIWVNNFLFKCCRIYSNNKLSVAQWHRFFRDSCSISFYCHPWYTAPNCGEQTVELQYYQVLTVNKNYPATK
jgi:hypothetical protein